VATGINNLGTALGTTSANGPQSYYLRSSSGVYQTISCPDISAVSLGFNAINDHGDTTGTFYSPEAQGFMRTAAGMCTVLP
jgi:hypothetical protein